jgi:hypothetical protein
MSWKNILKADFMPMGNNYGERLDNLIHFVNNSFPELKQNMIKFQQEHDEIVARNEEDINSGRETDNIKGKNELLNLQTLFTRRNGVRDAYVKIINSIRDR